MANGTEVDLPEFDLDIHGIAIELGSSEGDALDIAITAADDFEVLDIYNLGIE